MGDGSNRARLGWNLSGTKLYLNILSFMRSKARSMRSAGCCEGFIVHAVSSRSLIGTLLSVHIKIEGYTISIPLLTTQVIIPRSSMVTDNGFVRNKLQSRSEPQDIAPSLEDFRMGPDCHFSFRTHRRIFTER